MDKDFVQESRRAEIPKLVEKYKRQIDAITDAVSKPLPTFSDIRKKEDDETADELVITAEQQLFSFISVRVKAIDAADEISRKVNLLELELNAPAVYAEVKRFGEPAPAAEKKNEPKKPRNHARANAE